MSTLTIECKHNDKPVRKRLSRTNVGKPHAGLVLTFIAHKLI